MSTSRLVQQDWKHWSIIVAATAGIVVVVWAALTAWGAVVHGHPTYAVLLGVTVVISGLLLWRQLRRRGQQVKRGLWRAIGTVFGALAFIGWALLMAWFRPHTATEVAIDAMRSDDTVQVTETATQIIMEPADGEAHTGVFYQPGALVEARAYAAVMRPAVEAGNTVIIAKQPLALGLLALGAYDTARATEPDIEHWVIGGHSLGGTTASMHAESATASGDKKFAGLLFYASYPLNDLSDVLMVPVASISGSEDGLATPKDIAASAGMLPVGTVFTEISGASHAQFGDYGLQAGDGTAEISNDAAREQIGETTLRFLEQFAH